MNYINRFTNIVVPPYKQIKTLKTSLKHLLVEHKYVTYPRPPETYIRKVQY